MEKPINFIIDCYGCGNKLEIEVSYMTEYTYCRYCGGGEGVLITIDKAIEISRLGGE